MKRLIVYAGANGAGKSTLRADAADPVDVEIDADQIARRLNPGNPRAADLPAAREALRLFDRSLRAGLSLSLETTLAGRTVLGRIRAAKDAGYDVTLRYVALNDTEKNIRRIDQRAAAGEHWIEPDTVRRRAAGSLDNLPAAIALADRSVLLDNSGRAHRRLLEAERSRITFEAPELPQWLRELMPGIAAALATTT